MRLLLLRYLIPSLFLLFLAGCPPGSTQREITTERAIEIARPHVTFQPKNIEAEKTTESGRPVWRVTFCGESVSQIHLQPELMIVAVDRRTGEIVSLSKS